MSEAARADATWYGTDGERYEALFVAADGTTWGRRGPADRRQPPGEADGYGARRGQEPAEVEEERVDPGENGANRTIIRVDSSNDRRGRISSTTTLQSYPYRVIGSFPFNGTSNTQAGGCSGTKVGPRAVLTASHCVMTDDGTITYSGYFNPGQTNSTWPNSSSPWAGIYLRDYRPGMPNGFDYAVIFLADNASTVALGWMGMAWYSSASGYAGRYTRMYGYPAGPLHPAGPINVQTCKASPRLDDRCDGWMYGMGAYLVSSDFDTTAPMLKHDHDISLGTSGAALYETYVNGEAAVLGVSSHYYEPPAKAAVARMRQTMFDDVCSWIADPAFQSVHDEHAGCHP